MSVDRFKYWDEFQAHLDNQGLFRMNPSLERISTVLKAMKLTRPACPAVQVVGTNGKGSTTLRLASLACAWGLKTGVHISPHFVGVRERIRLLSPGGRAGGDEFSPSQWLDAANAVMRRGGGELSYFELVCAIAARLFSTAGAEFLVLETGLGGSWDATTAFDLDCVLFTPIDLDHQNILGNNLTEIARDKAGAIRPGKTVISARQKPEARVELLARARELKSPYFEIPDQKKSEAPDYPAQNSALARYAWGLIGRSPALAKHGLKRPTDPDLLRKAEEYFRIPGRMQEIPAKPGVHPSLLLDGAHNAHGLAGLGLALARRGIAPGAVIFACLADKKPEGLIPHLRALSTGPILATSIKDNPRAMPAADLSALIGLNARPAPDLLQALALAAALMAERLPDATPANPLLICGSLYLLGEFFTLFPEYL